MDERVEHSEFGGDAALGERERLPDPRPAVLVGPTRVAQDFPDFYRDHFADLVAFLMWQGARLADATDAAQETMRRAFQHWSSIEHPKAWTRRVASREYGRRLASLEDPFDDVPAQSALVSDQAAAEAVERSLLLQLLSRLPARQRQVMAWTYDGFTPAEIAVELSMKAATVRSTLRGARETLAALLAEGDQ